MKPVACQTCPEEILKPWCYLLGGEAAQVPRNAHALGSWVVLSQEMHVFLAVGGLCPCECPIPEWRPTPGVSIRPGPAEGLCGPSMCI